MKTYTVYRTFKVEARREISAENMAEAEAKANQLKTDRWVRSAPGAELTDWSNLSGTMIAEERE